MLDEFIRNNERKTGILREDKEERIGITANDTELAEYYQQVKEALAEKGRTKGTTGAEDRKREEQLSVSEQQAKRNRRRAR